VQKHQESGVAKGAGAITFDYMQNIRSLISSELVLLEIEVRSNEDDTFETNLRCSLHQCGKTVDIDSDGPKAVQMVSCPEHGFLTSFPHRVALGEFVTYVANRILQENGQRLNDVEAAFIVGGEQARPESMN
jgi:hypothetical protein